MKRLAQNMISPHSVCKSYVDGDDLIYFPYQKQYLSQGNIQGVFNEWTEL